VRGLLAPIDNDDDDDDDDDICLLQFDFQSVAVVSSLVQNRTETAQKEKQ
jgi:hypothetical protein